MAEETDPQSKTEEPTQRRLDEARRKGDVAKSPDLPQWASLAAAGGVLAIGGGWMAQRLVADLTPFFAHPDAFALDPAGAMLVLRRSAGAVLPVLALVLVAAAAAGAGGNLMQHGLLWAPEKVKPEARKISPLQGFKRLFGVDGLVQFLKSALKVVLLGLICWMVLKPRLQEMQLLAALEPAAILPFALTVLKALFFSVLGMLGVLAAADFLWQRHRFMKRMRMSREELKDEFKQSEGDPHVRARQRQLRTEKAKQRMIQNVPKATVVVMNPTHYAVALRYESGETDAPVCLAKGLDAVALKIREVAEAAGVPVVEDPPLARALYAAVEVDQAIPQQHYEAVAKVIGFILSAARKAVPAR